MATASTSTAIAAIEPVSPSPSGSPWLGSWPVTPAWPARPARWTCASTFQARRADIECFARDLEARGRARATITRRLCTIAGFCNYAVEEELLDHSPAAHVRRPRLDYESHVTGLDRDELGALLVAAGSASPPSTRSSRCWPQRAACLRSHRRQHRVPGRRARAPDVGGHPQGRQDSSHAAKPTSCHHRWASLGEPSNYAAAKGHR